MYVCAPRVGFLHIACLCSTRDQIVTLLNSNWLSLNSLSRIYVVCCCCCCLSYYLHQFHEMLIHSIHIFGFVHKILVTAPTIPIPTKNSWFIHWPNKEKKLPFLFINSFEDLETVYFKPEVTTGHDVRACAALADKRIPVVPGLSCLLANATKDDVMSYVTCSKTISGLLYEFNRSIWNISFQKVTTGVAKQDLYFWDFQKFIT